VSVHHRLCNSKQHAKGSNKDVADTFTDRTGERFFHITIPLCFAVFAYILAAATTKAAPRYVAMMFMVPGVSVIFCYVSLYVFNIF
jgi:hypothetical protein